MLLVIDYDLARELKLDIFRSEAKKSGDLRLEFPHGATRVELEHKGAFDAFI